MKSRSKVAYCTNQRSNHSQPIGLTPYLSDDRDDGDDDDGVDADVVAIPRAFDERQNGLARVGEDDGD